jgi:hypothetical protein
MAKKGFFKEAQLKQQRTRTRVDLLGGDGEGVNIQDARKRAAKTPKEQIRATMQRMKEYKQGYVERTIDNVKRYK